MRCGRIQAEHERWGRADVGVTEMGKPGETQRETERQTVTKTDHDRDREQEKSTETETERQRDQQTDSEADRYREDRQQDTKTDRWGSWKGQSVQPGERRPRACCLEVP